MTRPDGWLIVFIDVAPGSVPHAWVVGWLPRGLRHVYAMRHLGDGVWLEVDPQATRFAVEFGSDDGKDVPTELVSRGCTVVVLPPECPRPDGRVWLRGWMTCVALVKYLCGIRGWRIWTPPQLLRACEARGYEVRRP